MEFIYELVDSSLLMAEEGVGGDRDESYVSVEGSKGGVWGFVSRRKLDQKEEGEDSCHGSP